MEQISHKQYGTYMYETSKPNMEQKHGTNQPQTNIKHIFNK